MPIAMAEHVMAEMDVGELGCQPGKGRPGLHERIGLGVESVEVVGNPQRVEVLCRDRENVLLLIDDDRLMVAPAISDDR